MANDGFNGTTISFDAGPQTPLLDVDHGEAAAKIQISGSTSAMHEYIAGLPDHAITFNAVGFSDLSTGDTGAVVINWFSGDTETFTKMVVLDVNKNGSLDDKIGTAITVAPTPA